MTVDRHKWKPQRSISPCNRVGATRVLPQT